MKNKVAFSVGRQMYLKQLKKRRLEIIVTQLLIVIGFFVLWEIAADLKWIDAFITSQPSRMFNTIILLHENGTLYAHIGTTIWETMVGFILGTIGGIIIAIILWWSDFISRVFEPYLVVLNALPKVALGPILIVWLGNGQTAIIAMALLISIIVSILTVLQGFISVDEEKIKLIRAFGAGKFTILTKVIWPASLPNTISALKVNVGLSWVGVIMGEFLVSKAGLGYLIVYGSQVFKLDLVMTSVIILIIAATAMYLAVVYLEKKLIKWQ